MERGIAVVVGEVEARHGGCWCERCEGIEFNKDGIANISNHQYRFKSTLQRKR